MLENVWRPQILSFDVFMLQLSFWIEILQVLFVKSYKTWKIPKFLSLEQLNLNVATLNSRELEFNEQKVDLSNCFYDSFGLLHDNSWWFHAQQCEIVWNSFRCRGSSTENIQALADQWNCKLFLCNSIDMKR